MQKKSRFLTGLLSAVMALTLFALPATAAGEDTENDNATVKAVAIDKTVRGSIEIHKYIYNGEWNKLNNGTGENSDAANVPSDGEDNTTKASPLANVTFTAYQVMDADQLVEYYNKLGDNAGKNVTIEDYKNADGTFDTSKSSEKDSNENPVIHSATTTATGIGTIENLPVGMYAVFETAHPAGVTSATPAFLVSIPMTKRSTDAEWMYKVVVYPKNKTTAAPITLKKIGKTGSINDGNLGGYKFKLEKYNENNETSAAWVVITGKSVDGQDTIGAEGDVIGETGGNGEITVDSLTPGIYRFTEVEGPANSGYIIDKDSHYYFEVTTAGAIAAVDETKEPAKSDKNAVINVVDVSQKTVTVTNHKPDLEKKVEKTGEEAGWQKAADYSAGDMVPYQITVKVPENITKLKTFIVTDTPTNLVDQLNTIKVESNGEVLAESGTTSSPAIKKIDKTTANGFTIEFNPAKAEAYKGKDMVITYKAELQGKQNNNAAVSNSNNANLTYSNVIDSTTTEDSKKTIEDETVVYSFKLAITKTGDDNTPLDDVEFDLYKEVDSETKGAITGDTAKALGLNNSNYWLKVNANKIVTKNQGKAELTGLANGTYYLVETKTHADYNLLSKAVMVKLQKEYNYKWDARTEYDGNGNVKHHEVNVNATKFDTNEKGVATSNESIKVINRKGFDLPVTGGFGTLLFSGIGALLVVGGVGVLMGTKKKKDNA